MDTSLYITIINDLSKLLQEQNETIKNLQNQLQKYHESYKQPNKSELKRNMDPSLYERVGINGLYYICPRCDYQTERKDDMEKHNNRINKCKQKYTCHPCKFDTFNYFDFCEHVTACGNYI